MKLFYTALLLTFLPYEMMSSNKKNKTQSVVTHLFATTIKRTTEV